MKQQNQQFMIIGGVSIVAVMIFVAVLAFSNNAGTTSRSGIDYSALEHEVLEDGTYVLGNPDAPVTIIEFADFMCPYCQEYKSVIDQVIEELVVEGLARFEFRTYPILGPDAIYYAQLLECAADQQGPEAFWVAHEELFYQSSRNVNGNDAGRAIADEMGLDYGELLECTADAEGYRANLQAGQIANVQGTPAMRVRYAGDDINTFEPIGSFERAGVPFGEIENLVTLVNGG